MAKGKFSKLNSSSKRELFGTSGRKNTVSKNIGECNRLLTSLEFATLRLTVQAKIITLSRMVFNIGRELFKINILQIGRIKRLQS